MPKYLVQVAYTPYSWAAMVKNPQSRLEAVGPAVESMGGKFEDAWLAFGEYDLVGICDFPDNVSVAAFSVSVAGKNSVKALHITPLMTMDEVVEAMRKAGASTYAPPNQIASIRRLRGSIGASSLFAGEPGAHRPTGEGIQGHEGATPRASRMVP